MNPPINIWKVIEGTWESMECNSSESYQIPPCRLGSFQSLHLASDEKLQQQLWKAFIGFFIDLVKGKFPVIYKPQFYNQENRYRKKLHLFRIKEKNSQKFYGFDQQKRVSAYGGPAACWTKWNYDSKMFINGQAILELVYSQVSPIKSTKCTIRQFGSLLALINSPLHHSVISHIFQDEKINLRNIKSQQRIRISQIRMKYSQQDESENQKFFNLE